jgi:preprotein translocase subunit SecG
VFAFLIVIHVIISCGLMLVVLMQSSKGEGLAGAFGGGGLSGAVFGGRGAATFLSKATTVLAILFMVSCIVLTFVARGRSTSQVGESAVNRMATEQPVPTQAPVQGEQQQGSQQGTQPGTQPGTQQTTPPSGGK